MANFRSLDSIILSMLDYIRLVQPEADTKPGTLFRDIAVDPTAQEISRLYADLRSITSLQSYATSSGSGLDRLAANFSAVRGTGAVANGAAVFTATSLDTDVAIPIGTAVTSRSGVRFRTMITVTMSVVNSGIYSANASRMRSELDSAGITDEYAIEVPVEAISPGAAGNISKYSLNSASLPGISAVTNLQTFSGGSNAESDATFRSRILSIFAGSNIGTAMGYINTLRADTRVIDVLAVEPGDPLMSRDGTQISTDSSGKKIVVDPGTGGKVDLYIQGRSIEDSIESYIYKDLSGKGNPTDAKNDYILGQRGVSAELNFQQRRRESIRAGTLPLQPVLEVVSVSGSSSGANFIQKYTDASGNYVGNFELDSDEAAFGGSPFGFDKIRWINNKISLSDEAIIKGVFNGQDATAFSDVQTFNNIHQQITVKNESAVLASTDRSTITLQHTPVLAIDRVYNATTGERYTVANSNPDGVVGESNSTGRVFISGNTLPVATDNLEISYLWDHIHDSDVDFDDLSDLSNFRTVQDSIDWGFSNRVELEETPLLYSLLDGYYVMVTHPVSRVIDASTIHEEPTLNINGKVVVSTPISNILSILDDNSDKEVYYTKLSNGSFTGSEITLPTDTSLALSGVAFVRYNVADQFSPDGYDLGTFTGAQIKIPNASSLSVGTTLYVSYVADLTSLLPTVSLLSLPAVGNQNAFTVSLSTTGTQPITNVYSGSTVIRNLRYAPSYLRINLQGTPSRGRLTIIGHAFRKREDIITVTHDGLVLDLQLSILNFIGLSSIPNSGFVARVESIERVTVANDLVSNVDFTFDTLNYELSDNRYSRGRGFVNPALSRTQVSLAATQDNLNNSFTTGQKLRVTYYYCDTNQSESLVAGASGVFISKYKYAYVSSITVASGFTNTSGVVSGNISITSMNQPVSGIGYLTTYDYTAPKEGERITIKYNYNKLITDSTFSIERVRPITADVLIKQASPLAVDIGMKVVVASNVTTNTTNILRSVEQTITIFTTATGLNTILDASDLISAVYQVTGVDRVVLTKFNLSGLPGIVKSISAERNQYIILGEVSVVEDSR